MKRYYAPVPREWIHVKGKNILTALAGKRWFYYPGKLKLLRGMPNVKFWFFYNNYDLYYQIAQVQMSYIDDLTLADYINERRSSVIIFNRFFAHLRPRHWKFWFRGIRFSQWEILDMYKLKYDSYFLKKEVALRRWHQWERFYFLLSGSYNRYVMTEYWMILFNRVSKTIFSTYPYDMLYSHTFLYKTFLHWNFKEIIWYLNYIISPYIFLPLKYIFFFIKSVVLYFILFFCFNINSLVYNTFFSISYILTFFYVKFWIEIRSFLLFIQTKDLYSQFSGYHKLKKEKWKTKKQKSLYSKKKENNIKFWDILESSREIYAPYRSKILFPHFLYFIVYKVPVLSKMLIDFLYFLLYAFFDIRYEKNKTPTFFRDLIKNYDIFYILFLFNFMLVYFFISLFFVIKIIINKLRRFFIKGIFFTNMRDYIIFNIKYLRQASNTQGHRTVSNFIDAAEAIEYRTKDDLLEANEKPIDLSKITYYWHSFWLYPFLYRDRATEYVRAWNAGNNFIEDWEKQSDANEFLSLRYDDFKRHHYSYRKTVEHTFKDASLDFTMLGTLFRLYSIVFFGQFKNRYQNLDVKFGMYNVIDGVFFEDEKKKILGAKVNKSNYLNKWNFYNLLKFNYFFLLVIKKLVNILSLIKIKWFIFSSIYFQTFYYFYFYIMYSFFMFSNIISWIIFIIFNWNWVLITFYYSMYRTAFIRAMMETSLGRFVYNCIIKIRSFFQYIRVSINNFILWYNERQKKKFLPLSFKLFFVYIYFVFIQYNIIWKILWRINIKIFQFITLIFIITLFFDYESLFYFYFYMEKTINIMLHYVNYYIFFFEKGITKYFYYYFEHYYIYVYEKNNILINVSYYDKDLIHFIRKAYERTLKHNFWKNQYILNTVFFFKYQLHIELNWWIMQLSFITTKLAFVNTMNFIYWYKMSVYWLIYFKHYKFFIFVYFYYTLYWLNNYFVYIIYYYFEFFNIDFIFLFIYNWFFFFFKLCNYYYYLIMLNIKLWITSILHINNYHYLFYLDNASFLISYWPVNLNVFINLLDIFKSSIYLRFYVFVDILEYYQFLCFNYYYLFFYFFSYIFSYLNSFFSILIGEWYVYNNNLFIFNFVNFIFQLFSPLYLISSDIFENWDHNTTDFRYLNNVGFIWPEIKKEANITFGITIDKFLLQSLHIKKQALLNYFFELKLSKNYNFYMQIYLFHFFFITFFIYYFVAFSKSFSMFFRTKYFFSFGPFSSWEKLHSKKMTKHNMTNLEWYWIYNLDWIQSFRKFHFDVFKGDPFYDEIPMSAAFDYLYSDITHVFVLNRKLNVRNQGFKLMLSLENYYEKRYSVFCQHILTEMDKYRQTYSLQMHLNLYNEHQFWMPKNFIDKRLHGWKKLKTDYIVDDFNEWKILYAVPYLYQFCDDPFFVPKILVEKNNPILRWLYKFKTIIDEKDIWKIDPIDFVFFEKKFWDVLNYNFGYYEEHRHLHGLVKSRFNLSPIFLPVEELPHKFRPYNWGEDFFHYEKRYLRYTSFLTQTRMKAIYDLEDKLRILSDRDDKYFNGYLNFTLWGIFSFPKKITTRIELEQLKSLHNAWDEGQWVEFVPYIPSGRFQQADAPDPAAMEKGVHKFWEDTLKHNDKFSTANVKLSDMALDFEWGGFNMHSLFLTFWALIGVSFFCVLDDSLYNHKHPFDIESAISAVFILLIQKLFYGFYINEAGWFSYAFQTLPGYAGFIAVENFEFVFLGSSTSYWNFFYNGFSFYNNQYYVATKYFFYSYDYLKYMRIDPFYIITDWFYKFDDIHLFQGKTYNLRWRDYTFTNADIYMSRWNPFLAFIGKHISIVLGFIIYQFSDIYYAFWTFIPLFIIYYLIVIKCTDIKFIFTDKYIYNIINIQKINDLFNKK